MAKSIEEELDEVEASWPQTKELAFVIDDPLDKLMSKAKAIFKGKYWDNLDGLALRIADACPTGVTDKNFDSVGDVVKVCKKYYSNVEKLRVGLNRPFLDAKKAVDAAAKEMVTRADPTLLPIINAYKKIEDRRKKEEEARQEAERRRVEEEQRAQAEAERRRVEEVHAAEKKKLADQAEADRKRAEAAQNELRELKKQMERISKPVAPKDAQAIVEAPDGKMVPIGKMCQMDDHGFPIVIPDDIAPPPPGFYEDIMQQADASALFAKHGTEVDAGGDEQKVRDYGKAVKDFIDSLKRPLIVKREPRQAVELAVFDLYEIANRLQDWRMP